MDLWQTGRFVRLALGGALISTALIGVAVPASAADSISIAGPSASQGFTAVHGGQQISISGSGPNATIDPDSVKWIATMADGTTQTAAVPAGFVNTMQSPGTNSDYLNDTLGFISGALTLPCLLSAPNPDPSTGCSHPIPRTVALSMTISGETLTSAPLRIDYTPPIFLYNQDSSAGVPIVNDMAELVSPTQILVRFSEPVVEQQNTDAGTDWTVGSPADTVTQVSTQSNDCAASYTALAADPTTDPSAGASGCTRLLTLQNALGEDATPTLHYDPSGTHAPGRLPYQDLAGFTLDFSQQAPSVFDKVRPRLPNITAVDGGSVTSANQQFVGHNASPSVSVGNVTPGDKVVVDVKPSGSTTPVETAPVTFSAATGVVPISLPSDGTFTVTAVAIDPAGNRSDNATEQGPGNDGTTPSVSYDLDRVPPVITGVASDGNNVTVNFSEPVTGPDSAADWTITDPNGTTKYTVGSVGGNGATRTLAASGVPQGALVSYAPKGDHYVDVASNPLAAASAVIGAPGEPVISAPTALTYLTADHFDITGQAPSGEHIDLLADTNGDGKPDGQPITTTTSAPAFTLTAPLPSDGNYAFLLVARSPDGSRSSAPEKVPTLVRDTTAPTVSGTAPAAGAVLNAGDSSTVSWAACDLHLRAVAIDYSADNGATWSNVGFGAPTACGATGSFAWTVPAATTDQAMLRFTATDLAGNTGVATVGPFSIRTVAASAGAITSITPTTVSNSSISSGSSTVVSVAGRGGVPSQGARAAFVQLTASGASGNGGVLATRSTDRASAARQLSIVAHRTTSTTTLVPLGSDGRMRIYVTGTSAHVTAVVLGYSSNDASHPGSRFSALRSPSRLLSYVALAAHASRVVTVTNVPTSARTVTVTLTSINPSTAGALSVGAYGSGRRLSTGVTPAHGQNTGAVAVPLGSGRRIVITNSGGATHFTLWTLAYTVAPTTTTGDIVVAVTPARAASVSLARSATRVVVLAGHAGVPSSATAVIACFTVTGQAGRGSLTASSYGASRQALVSAFVKGPAVTTCLPLALSSGRIVLGDHSSATKVLIDVVGYATH
jgi:hypothetical protein